MTELTRFAAHILAGIGEGDDLLMGDKSLTIADAEKRRVPCEVYSRCVGYLRPVSAWNIGKQAEWQDRVTFKLPAEEANDGAA